MNGGNQAWQQIRCDGVDNAQAEGADQRILALLGDFPEPDGLFQYPLGLLRHLLANRCQPHFGRTAFKEGDAVTLLDLLERNRERRLADMAFFGRPAKVALIGQGDDVTEFSEGHSGLA